MATAGIDLHAVASSEIYFQNAHYKADMMDLALISRILCTLAVLKIGTKFLEINGSWHLRKQLSRIAEFTSWFRSRSKSIAFTRFSRKSTAHRLILNIYLCFWTATQCFCMFNYSCNLQQCTERKINVGSFKPHSCVQAAGSYYPITPYFSFSSFCPALCILLSIR